MHSVATEINKVRRVWSGLFTVRNKQSAPHLIAILDSPSTVCDRTSFSVPNARYGHTRQPAAGHKRLSKLTLYVNELILNPIAVEGEIVSLSAMAQVVLYRLAPGV